MRFVNLAKCKTCSAARTACLRSFPIKWQPAATARKQAIVTAEITDGLKVFMEARFMQHPPGVAADREDAPDFNIMMLVQYKAVWMIGYGAAIDYRLPMILAGSFELIQFEQSIGCGIKTDAACTKRQLGVSYIYRPVGNQARIDKTLPMRDPQKIVPVECAAQAFAVHHRIIANLVGHAPVGVHVGEIKFTARFEQAMHSAQYGILVRRQIDYTVGYDDIKTVGLQPKFIETLNVTQLESYIVKTEQFAVVGAVAFGDSQLLFGHIHPNHAPMFAHELRQGIDIPPGAAAQIEHTARAIASKQTDLE